MMIDGEFEYKGKVTGNADIKKLIIHTLWNNNKTDIKGLKIFYQALSSLNLPKHLITNKIGRSIMKQTRRNMMTNGDLQGNSTKNRSIITSESVCNET